jgi:hypothetical protein
MCHPIDPFTPAVELAAAIRRKEVSPVESGRAVQVRTRKPGIHTRRSVEWPVTLNSDVNTPIG